MIGKCKFKSEFEKKPFFRPKLQTHKRLKNERFVEKIFELFNNAIQKGM